MSTRNNDTKIVTFVGKGGVGKTSLSALTVRLLSKAHPDKKILAIDADPAVGLSTALGVTVGTTVDDIRKEFVEQAEDGALDTALALLAEAKYRMFDALVENGNVSFLAIGRPESAGCYCKVNGFLREMIRQISDHFDYVVIDGEAGIEQVNRRVMEKVTHLVLVSDASQKGLQVAQTIHNVAKDLVMFEKAGLVVNRMPDVELSEYIRAGELELLACIGDDREMTLCDMQGNSIFSLDENVPVLQGLKTALEKLDLI